MGRATRWLKGLFGIRNNKKDTNTNNNDKKQCSLGEVSGRDSSSSGLLCHNPGTIPPNITSSEAAWLRSSYYINETEKEQSKHAIAVAAATAAAADAAVAAAQAAVAVVRLTSQGRGSNMFGGGGERWAAVKIQTVFRGYLARKALRALKGLVKLQAHVRGYLVRKQATATLHSMQALIRAQATVRSQRAPNNFIKQDTPRLDIRARKSMERFDETRSEHTTASIHSRRLSLSAASIDNTTLINSDESPKIVEVDTSGYNRPKSSRSRKTNASVNSDFSDDQTLSSPLPSRVPPRISVPQESEWGFLNDHDQYRCSTAQSTPRFMNSSGIMASNLPVTPAKSVCADNFFGNHPNYMASTQSFKAKLRSHSAPKQRPEPHVTKKRLSLNELMESRNSLSGVRMQRSCSQVQEAINFKNAIMGKLDRSSTTTATSTSAFARDPHRNSFSRRC